MELDMDSRMARDEIDWFLRAETRKYIVFVLPMGMEREKMVVLTRLDIQIWGHLRPLAG